MSLDIKAIKYTRLFIYLIFFLNILFFSSCKVQEIKREKTGVIYEPIQVDRKAEFEEGNRQLIQFLSTNLEYPQEALLKHTQGKVIIKFVVEDDGSISNFAILRDIGGGCADEIIRVLQKTQGRWNSAKIKRKRVRSYYFLSVIFKIPTDNSKPYLQSGGN